jgi:hypothetical protein
METVAAHGGTPELPVSLRAGLGYWLADSKRKGIWGEHS